MAASEHLNSRQLKLFMTPQEIMGSVVDSVDRGYDEPIEDLWDEKLEESKGALKTNSGKSLYDSIADKGVQRHVTLQQDGGHLVMGQGHHRVAAAADIAKRTGRQMYIPVVYDEGWNYSNDDEYMRAYPQVISKEQEL